MSNPSDFRILIEGGGDMDRATTAIQELLADLSTRGCGFRRAEIYPVPYGDGRSLLTNDPFKAAAAPAASLDELDETDMSN